MGSIKSSDDIFFTKSMAEILEGQGKFEDALMIYNILKNSPDSNESVYYEGKIKELESLAGKKRK